MRWIFAILFLWRTWKYLRIGDAYLIGCFSHSVIRFRSITCKHERENILSDVFTSNDTVHFYSSSIRFHVISLSLIPCCRANHFTMQRTGACFHLLGPKSTLFRIPSNVQIASCILCWRFTEFYFSSNFDVMRQASAIHRQMHLKLFRCRFLVFDRIADVLHVGNFHQIYKNSKT